MAARVLIFLRISRCLTEGDSSSLLKCVGMVVCSSIQLYFLLVDRWDADTEDPIVYWRDQIKSLLFLEGVAENENPNACPEIVNLCAFRFGELKG